MVVPIAIRQRRICNLQTSSISSLTRLPNTVNVHSASHHLQNTTLGLYHFNETHFASSSDTLNVSNARSSLFPLGYNPFGVFCLSSSLSASDYVDLSTHQSTSKSLCLSRTVLIDDFKDRQTAAENFPSIITPNATRNAIGRFQAKIAKVKSDKIHVCASCGLFIPSDTVKSLHSLDLLF